MLSILLRLTNSPKDRLLFAWNLSSSTTAKGYAHAVVDELLMNLHFEQDQRIDSLASCVAFAS
jgi:hypothetical protein